MSSMKLLVRGKRSHVNIYKPQLCRKYNKKKSYPSVRGLKHSNKDLKQNLRNIFKNRERLM